MSLSERAIISNLKFIYKQEGDHLRGKLKYFQHRDDRDTHIRQRDEKGEVIRRWMDRGMGDSYNLIAQNCEKFSTTGLNKDVGARTLVLSPQVEFMAAIPAEMRMAVMSELTDATIERWFEEMRLPQAEYAFVLHRGEVKSDRPDGITQNTKEFIHSHVVLAATIPGFTEDRDNYKVYKEQLEDLHRVSTEEMERIWTRELGAERVQDLNQGLEELTGQLKQIDINKSQIILAEQERSQYDIDEAMLEIYDAMGLRPPEELLDSVYRSRLKQSTEHDSIQELLYLGFEIDDDEPNLVREMEVLGFDFSGEATISVNQDVVDVARELGFDIPADDIADLTEDEFDILRAFRDLGFVIPYDDLTHLDELDNILKEMQDLGFDIPIDGVEIEPQLQSEMIDLDMG